jgi:hypothetical protein
VQTARIGAVALAVLGAERQGLLDRNRPKIDAHSFEV